MPTFIEFCAGAGGLSSGLIKAGFKPLLLVDIDKNCCETLRANHPDTEVLQAPFETIDLSKYNPDMICGGVPCQSFSMLGNRKGIEDSRGELLFKFLDVVKKYSPKVFLIENVKGLLSFKDVFQKVLNFNENYVVSYKLLDASNFGVPQKRQRVFIVGVRKDINTPFEFPEESSSILTLRNVLDDSIKDEKGFKYTKRVEELYKHVPQGGNWKSLPENLQFEYLGKSYGRGGNTGYLKRLSLDEVCPTVLCKPSQKRTERCHPLYDRPLNVRESARIQTFDDDYVFKGGIGSQYKQIGNAVPVLLGKAIGEQIKLLL